MGGRKFKLGRAMKNAERKKRKPLNLVVSIPRNLLHIQVCPELNLSLCSEEPSVDDPHLTVLLPLSAFVNGRVRSLRSATYIPRVHAYSVTPVGYYLSYTSHSV